MSLQPLPTHPSSSFPTSLLFLGQSFTVQCTDGKGEEDTDSRNSHLLNHLIQFLRQFSSVQSCPTLCDPMDCSTPGLPVHHQLPESTQIHVHWVIPSNHLILVIPLSSCPQSFPASGSFPINRFFASGGQSIGVSASTSVPPMNTHD